MPSEPPTPAQQRTHFAAAYQVLADAITAHAFPGCAFGVLAGGSVVLFDALGHFTYDHDSPPVLPATPFDIASLTKVVATTAMTMLLSQRGLLHLDTPIAALLPGFAAARPAADPARSITLAHLLAHNSGLPGYVEFFRTASTPQALLQACLNLPLQALPGSRAEYSDPGFILLGKALEHLAGEPIDSWTEREIFAPLRMTSTLFCPPPVASSSISPTEVDTTFRFRRIQGEVQDENASVLNGVAGHAGLFSTLADLLTFARAVLSSQEKFTASHQHPTLFSRETLDVFARRQPPSGSSRALGWDTPSPHSSAGNLFSQHSIGHLGYSGCSLWIDLDASIAVVLLTNRTWPDRQSQLIREVRPAFHNAVRQNLS